MCTRNLKKIKCAVGEIDRTCKRTLRIMEFCQSWKVRTLPKNFVMFRFSVNGPFSNTCFHSEQRIWIILEKTLKRKLYWPVVFISIQYFNNVELITRESQFLKITDYDKLIKLKQY